MQAVHGRFSALFTLLAGVSLPFMTGGNTPKSGYECGHALRRIVIRAVLLMAPATGHVAYGIPVAVTVANYGVFFLFATPILKMRSQALLILAAVAAVI